MTPLSQWVFRDDEGALWVGRCRVALEAIVAARQNGDGPEATREQYVRLELDEIADALRFWDENPEVVADYLRRQAELWEQARAESEIRNADLLARLRAYKRSQASGPVP